MTSFRPAGRASAILLLLITLGGCQYSPFRTINAVPDSALPLEPGFERMTPADDTVTQRETADGLFVGVALSGGGSRSAIFATEILATLHESGVMSKVDYVSTVSGGSLAGAYYCMSRDADDAGPPEAKRVVWEHTAALKALSQNFWPPFVFRALNPVNATRYVFTGYNRSSRMADTLDARLFEGRTLSDLNPRRPKLIINATDLETGNRFPFTNAQLKSLGVDARRLRIADAVQASAAFPGLFQPRAMPRYKIEGGEKKIACYVQLVDGGVRDNLGLDTLRDLYVANRDKFPKGAVFIVCDATLPVKAERSLYESPDTRGGLDYVIDVSTGIRAFELIFDDLRTERMRAALDNAKQLNEQIIVLNYVRGFVECMHCHPNDQGEDEECRRSIAKDMLRTSNRSLTGLGKVMGLIAPTSFSITGDRAEVARKSAMTELKKTEPQINKVLGVMPATKPEKP